MKNAEFVKILDEIACFLELKGESVFKWRAYQKAARSIEFLSENVEQLAGEDRLREIPGVGEAIAKKLGELARTGRLEYYEKLKAEFPQCIDVFLGVPGIGPRSALLLTRELGVTSLDELEKAIADGRVAALPRMGEKTAQNILGKIRAFRKKKTENRVPIGNALYLAESIIYELQHIPGLSNFSVAGSLRRFRDTIGDIDILCTAQEPAKAIEAFTALPRVEEVSEKGTTKACIIIPGGMQVDLRVVEPASYGSALQYFTGSKQHNIDLRARAEKIGLSLSEYGITTSDDKLEKYASEEDFYTRQGLQFIPPELREGQREISAAEKGSLPELIKLGDIRGDLHIHSNWSDGAASIEEIAASALSRGYSYIAITDHSGSLGIARGLDSERVLSQVRHIKEIRKQIPGIAILAGIEVDIRAGGNLDLPDEILAELDIVLASIHSGMNQSEEQMTARVLAALENPHVDVIAHPTARLLCEREPVALNMEAVLSAAVRYRKALESNATPNRLDLKDTHIYQARERGIKLMINTDSHHPEQLEFMRYGVGTARRGWCKPGDILNTLPLEELTAFLKH